MPSPESTFNFRSKTVLITGGTSGIGRVTALALARSGANVVFTGRRDQEGTKVQAELAALGRESGAKALFVKGDVTSESHVHEAVERAVKLGNGRLDFAVNNAGLEIMNVQTTDATPEQYRKIFDINVLGVLLSMKHEIRAMLAGKPAGGSIVNTASVAGSIGLAGAGIYIASKHAVLGLTKSAALEVAKQGIRVNAVSPGTIETDMFDRFTGGRQPEALNWIATLNPTGRTGRPEEIAGPILFLLSDAASYITGADYKVDGALTVP